MAKLELIALTDAETGWKLSAQSQLAGQTVRVVEGYGLAAILAPTRLSKLLKPTGRKAMIKRLTQAQKRLEALIPLGPVLSVSGDTALRDEPQVLGFLAGHQQTIRQALTDFGRKVQFQITIRWPDAPTADGALKARLTERFCNQLEDVSEGILELPVDDEETLLNIASMIERSSEPDLDAAVEAIDAAMAGELAIKYRGPLPALSFATLTLQQPSENALVAARAVLGIKDERSTDILRAQYLDLMRANHPDAGALGTSNEKLTTIKQAYTLLKAVHEAQHQAGADARPILASITSDADRRAA